MPKIQWCGGKNMVTLPKEACEVLGWKPGEVLLVYVSKTDDEMTFRRVENDGKRIPRYSGNKQV